MLAIHNATRNSATIFAQRRHRGRETAAGCTGFGRTIVSVRVFDKVGLFFDFGFSLQSHKSVNKRSFANEYAGTARRASAEKC
jgi:hypothetical protein